MAVGRSPGNLRDWAEMLTTGASPPPPARLQRWPSVISLAEQIRHGQISPTEVTQESLRRIARLNPLLNAFVSVGAEPALAQAAESEARLRRGEGRPLEGVPLAIKDNAAVAGMPTTRGSWASRPEVESADAEVVSRLRRAGAIIIGKTNLPEFGSLPVTESDRLGACRNPWDPRLTPGGSSGGSAAAVAAGMVPAAHGNDGGGSLRIPASCCGVFSLKPSRGRISLSPGPGDAMAGLVSPGFLTVTVADTALLLDQTAGPAPGDPYFAPAPRLPFTAALARPGPRLRIGWTTVPPVPAAVDESCQTAVLAAAEMLEALGHEVAQVDPGWQRDSLALDFRIVWAAGMHASLLSLDLPPGDKPRVEAHVAALGELGARTRSGDLLMAQARLQLYAREVAALWQECDLILTPTLARSPLEVGELFRGAVGDPMSPMAVADAFTPFTPLFNVTGQPAASMPIHWDGEVPIGVQLVGRLYDEVGLLAVCRELEEASGWPLRAPAEPQLP